MTFVELMIILVLSVSALKKIIEIIEYYDHTQHYQHRLSEICILVSSNFKTKYSYHVPNMSSLKKNHVD